MKTINIRDYNSKKVNGQSLHEDSTLKMVENPDVILDHESEFFRDVCNLKIAESKPCTLLKPFAQKSQPAYKLFAQKVETAAVVGGENTDAKGKGKKGWFWIFLFKFAPKIQSYFYFENNRIYYHRRNDSTNRYDSVFISKDFIRKIQKLS